MTFFLESKNQLRFFYYLISFSFLISCSKESPTAIKNKDIDNSGRETGTVTDIDGTVYKTVKIGNQWWMVENLKAVHYRNGDEISNVTDDSQWSSLSTGAYCNFLNYESNVATYGRLYNWYAVSDARSIAPAGWHVATQEEWGTLVRYLGGSDVAGGKMKESGTARWLSPNTGATNESGFSAVPGGYRENRGLCLSKGGHAYFWSSTEFDSYSACSPFLYYNSSEIFLYGYNNLKVYGLSVRCVQD